MRYRRVVYRPDHLVVSLLLFGVCLIASACGPPQTPLVRDFDTPAPRSTPADSTWQVHASTVLEEAGWSVAEERGNTLKTEARTLSRWGVYRVDVHVELVAMRNDRIRLFWQPYRMYATGGRSKIPYMPRKLRRTWVKDLTAALEEGGFRVVETRPRSRDVN